ncbi:MAG: MBL fold metallo-hydrolase [Desulfitobacteriaceae bacterium]
MPKLKITILVENTVGVTAGVIGEWGLAMFLDFGDEKILIDTGEQGNIVGNAGTLEIDLHQIDRVILSHGHYDHTGGLIEFLKVRGKVPVYAHPEIFSGHYGPVFNGAGNRFIGVPFRLEQLVSAGAEFHWVREPVELRPGLWLSGEVPRRTEFEMGDTRLVQDQAGTMVHDPLKDDFSVFYATDTGLIILLGCAHAGVVNIIEYAKEVTAERRVRAVIGGTHLGPVEAEQKDKTIEYLKSLDLELLAPNHCTGLPMAGRLAQEFPAQFRWASAGTVIEFE